MYVGLLLFFQFADTFYAMLCSYLTIAQNGNLEYNATLQV